MSQGLLNNKSKNKSSRKRVREVTQEDQDEVPKMSKKIIVENNQSNGLVAIRKQDLINYTAMKNQLSTQINEQPKGSKKSKITKKSIATNQKEQQQKQQISLNTRSHNDKNQQLKKVKVKAKKEQKDINPPQTQQTISSKTKHKKSKKKQKPIQKMEQQKSNKPEEDQTNKQMEENTKERSTPKKKKSKKKKEKENIQKQTLPENELITEIPLQTQQQLSIKTKQEDKNKGDSSSKSKSKAKKQNIQSINVLNRQMSRQCILPKSNFYLQKQDNLRKGLPVGRGSKKQQERIIKQRKKQVWQRSKRNKKLKLLRQVKQEVKQEQDESNKSVSLDKKSNANDSGKKGKIQQCTREQSIRILNIFQGDAGDYRGMVKELKTIPLKKIRAHLRMHFQRCIDIITRKAEESGRKIDDWDLNEKKQIVRELHRIRCTNRLLSEQNTEFRQKFMRLMRSYNDSSLTLEVIDYNFLYRKIEAFVRGFCTLNKRKTDHKFTEPTEQNRKHLLEGGYIMDLTRSLKRQVKIECKEQPPQSIKIDLQKIIYQWTEQQEKELGKLYMENQTNYQSIIEQLKKKFGERNRWKDFEILGRKIDHLVKMGINKMFQLTCKPYNRTERLKEEETKIKSHPKEQKCFNPSQVKTGVSSLDLMTKFIYNNKKALVKPEQPPENPIFKNISLLERQIFGHVQSFKVRHALVNLLSEQFPSEDDLNLAIQLAKEFAAFAQEWQRENNIIQIKKQHSNDEEWPEQKKQKTKIDGKEFSSEGEQQNQQGDKFDELVKQLAQYQQGKNIQTDGEVDSLHNDYELKQGDLDQINQENEYLNQDLQDITKVQSKYR